VIKISYPGFIRQAIPTIFHFFWHDSLNQAAMGFGSENPEAQPPTAVSNSANSDDFWLDILTVLLLPPD
jgi:hypothetical protein